MFPGRVFCYVEIIYLQNAGYIHGLHVTLPENPFITLVFLYFYRLLGR